MVIEDDGYSGAVLERPGLERVRDLAAEGRIDTVLVHAPDRLSCRYAYQVLMATETRRRCKPPKTISSSSSVCRNPDQARKDAATREQILAALDSKLRSDGPKSVVANKGYKRYLKAEKGAFAIDLDKARDEQRFDGMWVLRTNTELAWGVAPKLIIINELWDDAWARHLWDRTPVFDTFARAETTRDRIGGFGRASVASEWLARHAAPIACRSV